MSKTIYELLDAPSLVDTEDLAELAIEARYKLGQFGTLDNADLQPGNNLPEDPTYKIRRSWTTRDEKHGRIGHVLASKFVAWS